MLIAGHHRVPYSEGRYLDRLASERGRARRNREFIASLKDKPCSDCEQSFPPECMDFDHVSGSKKYVISQMAYWGRKTILREIAKCELVCSNCHRIRTKRRIDANRVQ